MIARETQESPEPVAAERAPSVRAGGPPLAHVLRLQQAAGNRATRRQLARLGQLARQEVQPKATITYRVGSPRALVLPPDEGDCAPRIVRADELGEADLMSDATVTEGPVQLAAMRHDPVPARRLARTPSGPEDVAPAPVLDPCDVDSAPAGALSEFEYDVRDGKRQITGVILDPETEEVIGYYHNLGGGVWRAVDREGGIVEGGEPGVEAPLLDPIDFIPTPGAVVKGAAVVGKIGLKVFGKFTAKKSGQGLLSMAAVTLPRLRATSKALFGRAARAAGRQLPRITRELTEAELNHSFDRHAAEWFGRAVRRGTDFEPWRVLLQQATLRGRRFAWSLRETPTIAHLLKTDSGYLVVQYSTEAGNQLMSAFRPRGPQLREMLKLVRVAGE